MQTTYHSQWRTPPMVNGILPPGYQDYKPMGQYHLTLWPGVSASDWCRLFEPMVVESRKTPYRALDLEEIANVD
jgi:hypothetical protein